jgi:ATP-binding cassette subfamily B protein
VLKKIFKILSISGKINFFLFFAFIVISPLLDVLSIGLLIPIIKLVLNNSSSLELVVNGKNLSFSLNHILYLLLLSTFVKGSLIIFYTNFQINKIWDLSRKIKNNILINYINQDYQNIINENSSIMLRNISYDVTNFLQNYFLPILSICSNVFLIVFMLVLLLAVDYHVTVSLLICFFILLLLNKKIINPILKDLGFQSQKNESELIRLLNNLFNFIKEIKFYELQNLFVKKLTLNNFAGREINKKRAILTVLPKIITEIIFVSVFCYLILTNLNNQQFLVTLGVYGVATIRIIPSINALLSAYMRFKNSKASYKIVEKNINLSANNFKKNTKEFEKIRDIKIKELNFKYVNTRGYTIKNLNLSISTNDKICIYGESGVGKSTFLNLLLGFLKPENYLSIKSAGLNINNNISSWRKKISYIPQNVIILDETLKENIIFSDENKIWDKKKYLDCIRCTKLEELVNKINSKKEKTLGEGGSQLSPGEKQRIGIARALYRNADVLILDEITNQLDKKNKIFIIKNILEMYKNKIVISVSHDQDIIKLFKKKYLFKDKKLIMKL